MSFLKKIRDWFRGQPADPEAEAEARKLYDDQATVRISQVGSETPGLGGAAASANMPPTPDVLHPDAGDN